MKKRVILSILLSLIINLFFTIFLSKLMDFDFEKKDDEVKIPIKLRYSELKNDIPTNIENKDTKPTPIEKPKVQEKSTPIEKKEIIVEKKEPKKQEKITKVEKPKEIKKDKEKVGEKKQKEIISKIEKPKIEDIKIEPIKEQKSENKKSGLESFLMVPDYKEVKSTEEKIDKRLEELYTKKELSEISNTQKKFLIDNLDDITKWTQYYLTRRGYPSVAATLKAGGINIMEFYLYPDGFISDIKVLKSSGYEVLDENSKFVIEVAHRMYPRPREKTLIRIYVHYII